MLVGKKGGGGGTYFANKDLSTFKLLVGHFGDGFLGFFGGAVLHDTIAITERLGRSVSNSSNQTVAKLIFTYPQPFELPLGRVRTSEKTTLPAVIIDGGNNMHPHHPTNL